MPFCWFCRALAHNIIIMSTEGTQRVIAQESVVGCLGRSGCGAGKVERECSSDQNYSLETLMILISLSLEIYLLKM